MRPEDLVELRQVARAEPTPQTQIRRAQIELAIAAGERSRSVAARMEYDEAEPAGALPPVRGYGARRPDGRPFATGHLHRSFPPATRPARRPGLSRSCGQGLDISHWSSRDLARQAVADGIAPAISDREVRRILNSADLQPHRTQYWRTARLDFQLEERAEKVLWCYANAARSAGRSIWFVCADEILNFQALERVPTLRAAPGDIERQEFEYVRPGR